MRTGAGALLRGRTGAPPHMVICSYLTPLLRLKSWSLPAKCHKPQSNVEAAVWLFQSSWITKVAFCFSKYFGRNCILHLTPSPVLAAPRSLRLRTCGCQPHCAQVIPEVTQHLSRAAPTMASLNSLAVLRRVVLNETLQVR